MYLGFFYNEDFVLGTIPDYQVHINAANVMKEDIVGSFLQSEYHCYCT